MNFNGKTVLVTGASGNLGQVLAGAFEREGANLILIDQDAVRLQKTFGARSKGCLTLAADLTDSAQVKRAVQSALASFDRIDVLCNVAGGFWMGPEVHRTADSDLERMLDMNVRSLLNVVREVVPAMLDKRGGKIINVAANSALRGVANMGAYCCSKDMVVRLTESMSQEVRDQFINVNCVLPSILDTQANRQSMPDADHSRWVKPEALSDVILFLASPAARAIHGAAIPVTGRI